MSIHIEGLTPMVRMIVPAILAIVIVAAGISEAFAFTIATKHSIEFVVAVATVVPAPTPLVASIAEAARLLSISRASVYALAKSGDLTIIKVAGNRSVIPMVSIEGYLAKRVAAAKPLVPVGKKKAAGSLVGARQPVSFETE
jgi:excisionase family DNA binding protein